MQLQYDTQDAVPEDLRESFVEFKDGDKTLFMHKDLAETKKEAYRFKGDLTHAQKLAQEKSERLQALELAEKERQADLEAKELESKKKNGQHEEILEHFKTQAQRKEEELQAKLDELSGSIKQKEKTAVVNDLASMGTDSTRAALKRLIDQDLDFGEDGSLVVLENGKATSINLDEYKGKLKELYPYLISESHGKGGGRSGALGSGGSGGVPATLEECKGDKKLEAAYFNNQLLQGN
tara:strand:+ start:1264 stop:1974 length:711 start_codon:yes stop_codon:yes gene_type:complete